jgi:signal peptidase I
VKRRVAFGFREIPQARRGARLTVPADAPLNAAMTDAGDGKRKRSSGGLPWWAYALIALFVVVVGLKLVVFELHTVPSGSMRPTFAVGDTLVVNKLAAPGKRGDVILFQFPENRAQLFAKRVIALPGETFEVLDGRPILDGWLAPSCHVGPFTSDGRTSEVYLEFLGDRSYLTMYDARREEKACASDADCGAGLACRVKQCGVLQGPYHVAPGEVWVMGDARNNSHDSRGWRGGLGAGVPFADVRGVAREPAPKVPAGGDTAFAAALEKCMRERPAMTQPPGH